MATDAQYRSINRFLARELNVTLMRRNSRVGVAGREALRQSVPDCKQTGLIAGVLGERSRLAASLFTAGVVALGAALFANVLGVPLSSTFSWQKAMLLIVGCDLLVAGLVVSAYRTPPAHDMDDDCALLLGAIADGVMAFAISAAAIIVLFGQSKAVERLGYFLAIFVLLPLSLTLAQRRQCAGWSVQRQQFYTFVTLSLTAGVLCAVRLLVRPAHDKPSTSLLLLVILVASRIAIAFSVRLVPVSWLRGFPTKAVVIATPLLLAVAAIPFVPPAIFSVLDIALALAAGLVAFHLIRAYGTRHNPPLGWARAFDTGVIVLCTLVVVYLGSPNLTLALTQNYFLGPASDVLHGHPMLVDTFSQYGVGMFYVLAAVFLVVPIGYGTFTLLLSGLTALLFVGIYVILRWSTKSIFIAATGLAVAVSVYVFGQVDSYADFPSTGVLRFGLPWLVVLCSLAAVKTTRHRRLFDALVLVIVAVAAAWSGEAGVYCLGTACALVCLDATIMAASGRKRLRVGARRVVQLIAASVFGVMAITLLTRVVSGAWADWGGYIEYIRLYTVGGFGLLPIDPWSPGLALGAMYTVSAIAIVLLALARPELVREHAVSFRAVTGLTALGVLVYTYFLGRSYPNNLVHISPPGVTLLFVWLGIIRLTVSSRVTVAVASSTAIFLGVMIVASESKDIGWKYPYTALGAVLGSASPIGTELSGLSHNPVVEPAAVHVADFVSSLGRIQAGLTILLTPNIETEALLRLGMANAVGSSNPCQESLLPQSFLRVATAVGRLQPGGIVVVSSSPQDAGEVLPIEVYTFKLLEARFILEQVGVDGAGLRAFRMTALTHASTVPAQSPQVRNPSTACA